ncbi:cupin domain-containing protein [Lactiplantibacillus daowaiensis]|uniref:Cupin domain-containing protein n=1 Tax=Lactiplantibacillus daowaiensis TaxID=2559918 RepID=A0ABW1RZP6_9LACO|nr:cupin [Lactiplantibacillus daowaiensis]
MQVYTGQTDIKLFENLIETPSQVVTHLVLAAGEATPAHFVNYDVIVVPIKGQLTFATTEQTATIYPGKIVQLRPNETHQLTAQVDSELMVIKSVLKPVD